MTTIEQEQFRLHVPFEMRGGDLSQAAGASVTLFGHRATLFVAPAIGEPTDMAREWTHWLLFDAMNESDAQRLIETLRARIPAFSVFAGRVGNVVLSIPASEPQKAQASAVGRAIFNGPEITLVPADQISSPLWAGGYGTVRYSAGLLEGLNQCPPVSDERLLAALELWMVASYENLPRTKFLTYMTILDSLSTQAKRGEKVVRWIEEKIREANDLGDPGIVGALGNLKRVSHKAALRALVIRAADQAGQSAPEAAEKAKLAATLYDARSELSHQGAAGTLDAERARELAAFVLRAAIVSPSILDVHEPEHQDGL
ncbi:hypothetical protein [Burkholderia vietnamiensis]|uniref:hypothetical protein n=1 Tax=Burkholderia vietnamiensis TaxID=60552 RepID=UPI001B96B5FD|nr:hypothetical protein [Burkholderia vietnamiensis]MBR8034729.1 hypothetical protein [Burkholderia vietnamiensis]